MQIKRDFAGSTDMWPTSAGGQLIEVANLTGFTVYTYTWKVRMPGYLSRGSPASHRHVGGRPDNFVVSAPCTAWP
jgi:hypothetical protein